MAKVFVSHAGDDAELADELHRWLLDDGHEVFLAQDLRDGIAIGDEWELRLYERLRWADAVVCVVTSAYLASMWCTAEVTLARSRGSRLLPLLAVRGAVHPLLRSIQHVDTTKDMAGARLKLSEALRRVDAGGGSGWPDGRSPFPGLRPFDTDQHRVFFGRTDDVKQLARQLRSPVERTEAAVLLVVGPSGCGKSSLVRAELLRSALAGPVQVVATIRPEFLDQLLASPELAALPTRTHMLRPLQLDALRDVIEGPARLGGIGMDADLGGQLLTSRYDQLGGVQGTLSRQAEAALAEAMAVGGRSRDQVIQELLRLVTVDEQGRPTRNRVRRDELSDPAAAELDEFIARRLLITDSENDSVVVGVAHEAFLLAWDPLAKAVATASAALRARRRIEQAAAEWIEAGRRPARLWERGQLAAAQADTGARVGSGSLSHTTTPTNAPSLPKRRLPHWWPHRHRVLVTDRVQLSPRARDFLLASIRRDRFRRGLSTTILSALLILALAVAGFVYRQQLAAEERQRLAVEQLRFATARQLVTEADAVRDTDRRTALLLGIAAQNLHPGTETLSSLASTINTSRSPNTLGPPLTGYTESVNAVAFASDGRTLATVSDDKAAILWGLNDLDYVRGHTQELACSITGRGLNRDEWDRYVSGLECEDTCAT